MSDFSQIATELRGLVIKMLAEAGSGHSAGAIDLADIFATIYFSDLFQLNPQKPIDPERDRIILSGGHTCPILYATLAHKGYFPESELDTLRQFGSRLQGHQYKNFGKPQPNFPTNLPGVENTGGSLGQGLSFAVGVAEALRRKWKTKQLARLPKVVCLCGDGELQEGQVWEAFMAASKLKLNHLTFIIDRNGIQIDGFTEDVMPLEPLKDKLTSFGLHVIDIDGHNHQSIYNALSFDAAYHSNPTAIIAHTIPGKNIDYMENQPEWHGKVPNIGETVAALADLSQEEHV
jgi:transketolase